MFSKTYLHLVSWSVFTVFAVRSHCPIGILRSLDMQFAVVFALSCALAAAAQSEQPSAGISPFELSLSQQSDSTSAVDDSCWHGADSQSDNADPCRRRLPAHRARHLKLQIPPLRAELRRRLPAVVWRMPSRRSRARSSGRLPCVRWFSAATEAAASGQKLFNGHCLSAPAQAAKKAKGCKSSAECPTKVKNAYGVCDNRKCSVGASPERRLPDRGSVLSGLRDQERPVHLQGNDQEVHEGRQLPGRRARHWPGRQMHSADGRLRRECGKRPPPIDLTAAACPTGTIFQNNVCQKVKTCSSTCKPIINGSSLCVRATNSCQYTCNDRAATPVCSRKSCQCINTLIDPKNCGKANGTLSCPH